MPDTYKINLVSAIKKERIMDFEAYLEAWFDTYPEDRRIDYRFFPDTEHLKEHPTFKRLAKAKSKIGWDLNTFINDNPPLDK